MTPSLSLPARIRIGGCATILRTAPAPDVSLAVWQRPLPAALRQAALQARAMPELRLLQEDTPAALGRTLLAELPRGTAPLAADILALARLFAAILGTQALRMRLDRIDDDACRRFHTDAVGLRLLCTYAGAGTEWRIPGEEVVRRLPTGAAAILKGHAFPGQAGAALPHRSPRVSTLPPDRRARLLLTLDEPGRFQ